MLWSYFNYASLCIAVVFPASQIVVYAVLLLQFVIMVFIWVEIKFSIDFQFRLINFIIQF